MATPLRFCPRFRRAPHLHSPYQPNPPPSSPAVIALLHRFCTTKPPHFWSSPAPAGTAQIARGLRMRRALDVEDSREEDGIEEGEGAGKKSRNETKREARRAVRWGMDLAEFTPPHIKKILRVVSVEEEVYKALMLVKRLGPDVREGKRRQFNYIGKLLRNVQPELMDSLIQASKDHDNSKLQTLMGQEALSDEDDEEEEIDSEEECQDSINAASRWFDGLINRDSYVTKEVYSLHNVEFDRQELRRLVRRVQTIEEANVSEENGAESAALTRARKSLLGFLQRLAKQSSLEA